jgi:hypothetical protein
MRKHIMVFIAFTLAAGNFLYAEIGLSAWGKGVFTPMAFSGEGSSVSAATFTSDTVPHIGASIFGKSENNKIGFLVDTIWNKNGISIGDNAKVWTQPFDFFKLTIGWFVEDDFRGSVGNTEFASWLLPNSGQGEDAIFTRFQATAGAHLKLEPIKWLDSAWNGLVIEAAIGSNTGAESTDGSFMRQERAPRNIWGVLGGDGNDLVDVYKAIHAGIAYTIPEIGFARAQFIGNNRSKLRRPTDNKNPEGQYLVEGLSKNGDADIIEAAFRFTGIEGFNADLGVKIPLEFETDTSLNIYPPLYPNEPIINPASGQTVAVQRPYSIALGLTYTPEFFNNLSILTQVGLSFGGWVKNEKSYKITQGFDISAWVNPSYCFWEGFQAGFDMGFEYHAGDTYTNILGKIQPQLTNGSEYFDFGIGPWVELSFLGGRIRTGIMVMIPGNERYEYSGRKNANESPFIPLFSGEPVISIPIAVTYNL